MRHCVAVFIQHLLALLATSLLAAAPAHAGELIGSVTLASHYKSDGQDENKKADRAIDPTVQTFLMYAFDSGLYVGNWNSSTNADPNTSLEAILLAGYMVPAGPGMADVGIYREYFPGAAYLETTRAYASYEAFGFKLRYVRTLSNAHFGLAEGQGTGSLKLEYNHPVNAQLTLKAAIGRSFYANGLRSIGLPDSVFYQAGLDYELADKWTFGAVVDGGSELGGGSLGYLNKTRLILSIKKSF